MADYLIQQETAEVLANQIRRIAGTETQYNLAEIAEMLSRIEGNVVEPSGDLTMYVVDYDGTILKTANLTEGQAFALPTPPTHDGLKFVEWLSCVPIKNNMVVANQADILVCPVYETISGATEIYVTVSDASDSVDLPTFSGSNVSVDWGDGTINTSFSHIYTNVGDYIIKITGANYVRGSYNYSLTRPEIIKVHLSNNMKAINDYAFWGCSNMKCISMSTKIKEFGSDIFRNCASLKQIIIPPNIISFKEAEDFLFGSSCEFVLYPYGITTLDCNYNGHGMNLGNSLRTLTLPSTMQEINDNGFHSLNSEVYYIEDGLYYISSHNNKRFAFANCDKNLTSITIPSECSILCTYALNEHKSLTDVTIPESISIIPSEFCRSCSSLSSISIHDKMNKIDEYAFLECSSLQTVDLKNINKICEGAFNGAGLTSLIIPENVEEIGLYAFRGCNKLKSVEFKSNPKPIEESCYWFNDCTSLTDITLHDSMKTIYKGMFAGCTSIANLDFISNVTEIHRSAFSGCTGLTNINISKFVTKIYETDLNNFNPFANCVNIESISVDSENENYYSENNCIIDKNTKYLISGCKNSIIPEGVLIIGGYAFAGMGIKSVTIPQSVTLIDDYAFYQCLNLTNLILPDNLKSINYQAFRSCELLTSIIIPSSVTNMEYEAFGYCTNLTTVTFNGTPTNMYLPFYGCNNLTTINVPWAEGEVSGAPWGATNATINYNYVG